MVRKSLFPSQVNASQERTRTGGPQRECMAVLYAVVHYEQYPTGRRFTLVMGCSALTRLFYGTDRSAKLLHKWALRLTEHGIVYQWRVGVLNHMPDAVS